MDTRQALEGHSFERIPPPRPSGPPVMALTQRDEIQQIIDKAVINFKKVQNWQRIQLGANGLIVKWL